MLNEPIYLYDDGIGSVEYVEHMGSDLTIVNSARVSFGKNKRRELIFMETILDPSNIFHIWAAILLSLIVLGCLLGRTRPF